MTRYLTEHNAAAAQRHFVANVEAWIAKELGDNEEELRW